MNRELVLLYWSQGKSADAIADDLFISRDAVFYHLRRARAAGDARADRRCERIPAKRKRSKIMLLSRLNIHPRSIAKMVGLTERMVQIRLKELG